MANESLSAQLERTLTRSLDAEEAREEAHAAQQTGEAGKPKPGTKPGAGNSNPPADEELEVTLGNGAVQRVKRSDLVSAWQKRTELAQLEASANEAISRNTIASRIATAVEGMSDEQRNGFFRALQDPSLFAGQPAQPAAPAQQQAPKGDDFLDRLLGGGKPAQPQQRQADPNDPMQQRLAALERILQPIAQFVSGEVQTRQQQTREQQVDTALDSFPVFSRQPGAPDRPERQWAKMTVLGAMAQGKSIDEAVSSVAALAAQTRGRTPNPPPQPRDPRGVLSPEFTFSQDDTPTPPTADDLTNGGIADRLFELLGQG